MTSSSNKGLLQILATICKVCTTIVRYLQLMS